MLLQRMSDSLGKTEAVLDLADAVVYKSVTDGKNRKEVIDVSDKTPRRDIGFNPLTLTLANGGRVISHLLAETSGGILPILASEFFFSKLLFPV